ncbi:endomembrane protein 70-domain containing protein [Nitzschia inconspicua]|uniref:Transmembrane 9 superfamily member n=1 Tax=Nitzschia inconspicua TaxID=303405 RepID=A0A9K3M0Y5_9STRA|nr:endomembrane protein 70-domain containing protein [Nitzschia inconspicua]
MDESGWMLIHADVFRPPDNYPMLHCVFVGSGVQMLVTVFLSIVFSAVGYLSPARRGSLMNSILVFYMLSGVLAGYSSASAPFLDVIVVAVMWSCVSTPLVFAGAYFGYKKEAIQFPTVTSTIARAIPPPRPLLHPMVGFLIAGVVPFAAIYVELFFIMTSLWMNQFYYVFGFTLVVYLILIVVCAEVTVLLVYYQLCAESSLVVVLLLCSWLDGFVYLHLQRVLVPLFGGVQDGHDLPALLWLHGVDLYRHVVDHWNGWNIDLSMVCTKDLWRNQVEPHLFNWLQVRCNPGIHGIHNVGFKY